MSSKVCMSRLSNGIVPNTCIGLECGQYNLCNGIVTVHKPKVSIRTIDIEEF